MPVLRRPRVPLEEIHEVLRELLAERARAAMGEWDEEEEEEDWSDVLEEMGT